MGHVPGWMIILLGGYNVVSCGQPCAARIPGAVAAEDIGACVFFTHLRMFGVACVPVPKGLTGPG